ncbi:MAG: hypothetical protein AAGE93_22475 [Bacteroidota bacterium]
MDKNGLILGDFQEKSDEGRWGVTKELRHKRLVVKTDNTYFRNWYA